MLNETVTGKEQPLIFTLLKPEKLWGLDESVIPI